MLVPRPVTKKRERAPKNVECMTIEDDDVTADEDASPSVSVSCFCFISARIGHVVNRVLFLNSHVYYTLQYYLLSKILLFCK